MRRGGTRVIEQDDVGVPIRPLWKVSTAVLRKHLPSILSRG